MGERSGATFLARPLPPVPQISERGEATLKRAEPKPTACFVDVRTIPPSNDFLGTGARLPRRSLEMTREKHRVLGLELFHLDHESLQIALDIGFVGHEDSLEQQKPDQREP